MYEQNMLCPKINHSFKQLSGAEARMNVLQRKRCDEK